MYSQVCTGRCDLKMGGIGMCCTDTEKKTAIVTGASSGIGRAISLRLLQLGWEVYGIGRDFDRHSSDDDLLLKQDFHPICLNLLDTDKLEREISSIRRSCQVSLLVNGAGTAYYGLHDTLNARKISEMIRVNLEVPMILSQLLLRDLKKNHGYIINISSVTASSVNTHGCAYGATKAGLASFGRSLFEEARKYGLKVVTISPDMTATDLYRNADFEASDIVEARLMPENVADAVAFVLERPENLTVTELTIRPQLHRIQKK